MPWLLIPSFLVSPGHHQRWHWICRINESLTSIRNDFKYTGHFSAAKFQEKKRMQLEFYMCPQNRSSHNRLNILVSVASWYHISRVIQNGHPHYSDVIMGAMASQITGLTIVYSTVYSGADQGKHESSASLAFGRGIHRWPVNSPHKWPVMRKMFPFDDVIMLLSCLRHVACIPGNIDTALPLLRGARNSHGY